MAVFSGNGSETSPSFTFSSDTNLGMYRADADKLGFATAGTGQMFLDSSGRLLVGTDTSGSNLNASLQVRNELGVNIEIIRSYDNAGPVRLLFTKSRGSEGSPTSVINGDSIGLMRFHGYDGTSYDKIAASISGVVDGVPSGDMPGKLVFSTTPAGSSNPTDRMWITSEGYVGVGTSNPTQPFQVAGNAHLPKLNGGLNVEVDEDEQAVVTYTLDKRVGGFIIVAYGSSTSSVWGDNDRTVYQSGFFGSHADGRTGYIVSDAGRTTSSYCGNLSITTSGADLIITKAVGSGSNPGKLNISILSSVVKPPTVVIT